MRVAQVIGKRCAAGVEAVVSNYCLYLACEDIHFDFIIDQDSRMDYPQEMIDRSIRYIIVPTSKNPIRRVVSLVRIFRKNRYDIVHAHMNSLNVLVLFAAWIAGIRVRISHNHSTTSINEGPRAFVKGILKYTGGCFSTERVCCGESAGRWLFGNRAYDTGKVVLLPNAIEVEKYRFDSEGRERIRREEHLEERLVIGHVGRFELQKNHLFLIEVFEKIYEERNDARLILVGDGSLRSRIEEDIRLRGLQRVVKVLGVRDDIPALYSAMDVFVLPSLYEGVPVVGIEAQASGLFCVISDQVTQEMNYTGNVKTLGLSVPKEQWAREVLKAAQKRIDRDEMGKRLSGSQFDIKKNAEQLEELYRRCVIQTK